MAKFYLPAYCNNDLTQVIDSDMIYILKNIIDDVMIENYVYYDNDDRELAIELIYPVVANIVFNPNFSFIKENKDKLLDLIIYLVTHLS